jgi:hypothetical protein
MPVALKLLLPLTDIGEILKLVDCASAAGEAAVAAIAAASVSVLVKNGKETSSISVLGAV